MPFTNGETIKGWGVVRGEPWHLAGIFKTEAEARAKARELGAHYEVHYGDGRNGSDDFVWSNV